MGDLIIRASSTNDWPDCELRTLACTQPQLFVEAGLEIRERRRQAAAAVGQSTHAAAAEHWREIMLGSMAPISLLEDVAMSVWREETVAGVDYDHLITGPTTAEGQIRKLVSAYAVANPPGVRTPLLIEQRQFARVPEFPGIILSGQVDGIFQDPEPDLLLDDLKNTRAQPAHSGQAGTYRIIARANGHRVGRLYLSWNRPVGPRTPQPPLARVPLDCHRAERHAWSILTRMHVVHIDFAKNRNPSVAMANSSSRLCSDRYCPLHGTRTCNAWTRKEDAYVF